MIMMDKRKGSGQRRLMIIINITNKNDTMSRILSPTDTMNYVIR